MASWSWCLSCGGLRLGCLFGPCLRRGAPRGLRLGGRWRHRIREGAPCLELLDQGRRTCLLLGLLRLLHVLRDERDDGRRVRDVRVGGSGPPGLCCSLCWSRGSSCCCPCAAAASSCLRCLEWRGSRFGTLVRQNRHSVRFCSRRCCCCSLGPRLWGRSPRVWAAPGCQSRWREWRSWYGALAWQGRHSVRPRIRGCHCRCFSARFWRRCAWAGAAPGCRSRRGQRRSGLDTLARQGRRSVGFCSRWCCCRRLGPRHCGRR